MRFQALPARQGALWAKEAITIFKKKPSFFVSSTLVFMLIVIPMLLLNASLEESSRALSSLLSIPILAIQVLYTATIMMGCQYVSNTSKEEVYYETELLSRTWRTALTNKDLWMLGAVTGAAIATLYFISQVVLNLVLGDTAQTPVANPADLSQIKLTKSVYISLAVTMVSNALTLIFFCMTPAIVLWQRTAVKQAIFYNVFACLHNWKAWVRWALTIFLYLLGISLLFSVLSFVAIFSPVLGALILLPVVLALLVVASAFFPICYFLAYKDNFIIDQEQEPALADIEVDSDY